MEETCILPQGGEFSHEPVMLEECMECLAVADGGTYLDCTAGGGGHSREIARRMGSGRLIAIDRDEDAIAAAGAALAEFGDKVTLVHGNFSDAAEICVRLGAEQIDGAIIDLGVSSYQLNSPERAFSYSPTLTPANSDGYRLDMRMDRRDPISAWEIVNQYGEAQLREILYKYGEERFAGRIAARIVSERVKSPINTAAELTGIIRSAVPRQPEGGFRSVRRCFQAVRIETNRELDVIEPAIRSIAAILKPGGRIAVMDFHSLEGRIVKQTYAALSGNCTCSREIPVCVCNPRGVLRAVNRKPIVPSEDEMIRNPRSRSAKLRAAEKI